MGGRNKRGSYTLSVEDVTGQDGLGRPAGIPADTTTWAVLDKGETVTAEIRAPFSGLGIKAYADWYAIEMDKHKTYTFTLSGQHLTGANEYEAYIGLYYSCGCCVYGVSAGDGREGPTATLNYWVRETGLYYVQVQDYWAFDEREHSYTLSFDEA